MSERLQSERLYRYPRESLNDIIRACINSN